MKTPTVSLRIAIPEKNTTKMMQFDPHISLHGASLMVREKLADDTHMGRPEDYGIFLADEDTTKGLWLEPGRSVDYYKLSNSDLLEYRRKLRTLRVRMLDGTVKTILVDDSQPVANLMVIICTKIGITNHDEYSLVRECVEEEIENQKTANFGTLTLRRRKEEKERDSKMDQLRKKLRTDDEVNWIDPSKTLREQGIGESEAVLLRRKFFFSDQNIDSRDPVQLSLLYVQARDAILDGTHPVTQEKACIFAGIQCQIQFGDYREDRHKSGFINLKEFLPQSYQKIKGIEKKIFCEHKKHISRSDLDSKVLYTKTARSLSTYGVTFYLVKEKVKGKNKLVPRLLGITKDSVLRLDEKTKEILKTWPLTTVRRWGASPNTFTLDFGDYADQFYSVQTTEAEQISQLIAGYIDIYLKKQQAKDHFGIEGEDGLTMVEDNVTPSKATYLQHDVSNTDKMHVEEVSVAIPAVMRAGEDQPYERRYMMSSQYTATVSEPVNTIYIPETTQMKFSFMDESQHTLRSTISTCHNVIHTAESDLSTKPQLPELGSDNASLRWIEQTIDTHKQNVGFQIAAMNAATAEVVTLMSEPYDRVDHALLDSAITTIATNLPEMTKGVRMIAALAEDDTNGERLLDAARQLCTAFSDLLRATDPEIKEPRQNFFSAVSCVSKASHQVITNVREEDESYREIRHTLLTLAKGIASTTAALVLKVKNISKQMTDPANQSRILSLAAHCALTTSQLVACAKVVAPTLQSPACQSQLTNAVHEVTRAVENLVQMYNEGCGTEDTVQDLSAAATAVVKTLNELLQHMFESIGQLRAKETIQEDTMERRLLSTDLCSSETTERIRKRVVETTAEQKIQKIKNRAEIHTDARQCSRLLAATKTLADATVKMIETAHECHTTTRELSYKFNSFRVHQM